MDKISESQSQIEILIVAQVALEREFQSAKVALNSTRAHFETLKEEEADLRTEQELNSEKQTNDLLQKQALQNEYDRLISLQIKSIDLASNALSDAALREERATKAQNDG